jgi:hypothetical protein
VYEYLEYKKGGARAKLLYSGQVRIKSGTVTRCIIDVNTRRMRINTTDINDAYLDYDEHDKPTNTANNSKPNDSRILTTQNLDDLHIRVDERMGDVEKINLIKSAFEKKTYYTEQVRTAMSWLAFESSKLDLAKALHANVADKTDYAKLEDVFTFSNSKTEFNKHINGK